jgi:hypothetical protein
MVRKILHESVAERNSLQCIRNSMQHRVRLVEVVISEKVRSEYNPPRLFVLRSDNKYWKKSHMVVLVVTLPIVEIYSIGIPHRGRSFDRNSSSW